MMRKIVATALVLVGAVGLSACDEPDTSDATQARGQELTVQAFGQQEAAVPYPADELTDSLERRNLVERLRRTNDANAIGYVYLMNYGNIVGYYVIKGKVSSTQSQMTTQDLVIDRYEGDVVVGAPGDDGSYGPNESGVFFFLSSGTMVTTSLDYIQSDEPLPINAPKLGE